MRVLVFENARSAAVGLFGAWLQQARGASLRTVTPDTQPDSAGDADLIVSLGSPAGAYEDIPWIHQQRALLRTTIERAAAGAALFDALLYRAGLAGAKAPSRSAA